jgi:hypothetical protein
MEKALPPLPNSTKKVYVYGGFLSFYGIDTGLGLHI